MVLMIVGEMVSDCLIGRSLMIFIQRENRGGLYSIQVLNHDKASIMGISRYMQQWRLE
jgi:hypothetical protein